MPSFDSNPERIDMGPLSEITLEATAGDIYTWIPDRPWMITAASVIYSEATDAAQAQAGIVSLDHDPAGAVARSEKATYTSEVSKAIGTEAKMLDGNGKPPQFQVDAGDSVIFELKTEMTATEAGKVRLILYGYQIPDGEI